jgi:hypothetical protein
MTKTAIRTKIAAADAATTKVIDHAINASELLGRSITYNGFGIIADVSSTRSRLYDAKEQIEKALAAMNATDWPTSQELDYLENA